MRVIVICALYGTFNLQWVRAYYGWDEQDFNKICDWKHICVFIGYESKIKKIKDFKILGAFF